MKNLVWLASFPKSGNTWMRVFLANLQNSSQIPVDINAIGDYWACSREIFDRFSALESTLLTDEETLEFRHLVYRQLNFTQDRLIFLKTHAVYMVNSNNIPLFAPEASHGAIYLVRNPLDLAASFAEHNREPLDAAIARMADKEYNLFVNKKGQPSGQLFEPVGSWDQHVRSWTEQKTLPVLVLRYEDLVLTPVEIFSQAARFAGINADAENIQRAVAQSSFETLRKQEAARGFREKPREMKNFFRKGKIGSWREELNPRQVAQIIQDHGAVMRQFGYLDDHHRPVEF